MFYQYKNNVHIILMGNYFSNTIEPEQEMKCVICNERTEKKDYIDLGCSTCNKRIKGYYHSVCLHNYIHEANGLLLCFNCKKKKEKQDSFV